MKQTPLLRCRRPGPARTAVLATFLTAFGSIAIGATPAFADPVPSNCSGTTTITCTFEYNGTNGGDGSPQAWTVPAGVTSASFELYGAQGGGISHGLGGQTVGTVGLTPGATVTILVGGAGGFNIGGFNGGGSTNDGGGGASDIRIGGTALANRVLVAGGGGGSTGICTIGEACPVGGAGGGTNGGNGATTPAANTPVGGGGGTQAAGGAAAGGATGGGPGTGGDASTTGFGLGGSGGGGYFGGAGGGDPTLPIPNPATEGFATAGGGGSGFVDPIVVTGGVSASGVRQGSGVVTLSYDRAPQTITFFPLGNRSIVESPFTVQGVSAPGGPVTFTATGPCGVNGARVTLLNTGTCTITAHQAGDDAYQPAADASRSFTIVGRPALRIGDRVVQEGDSGTHAMLFPVTLSRAVSVPVTVHWSTVQGTATAPGDFAAASGTLTFPAWQTSRAVSVTVKGDRVVEPTEFFTVVLSSPTKATIADGTGRGAIVNDD